MADTLIASLRASLTLDASGVEDTVRRFQELERVAGVARQRLSQGTAGFPGSAAFSSARNIAQIGEAAQKAAVDTVTLIEKLKSFGANQDAIAIASQKFAAAMRQATTPVNVKGEFSLTPSSQTFRDILPNVRETKREIADLISFLDKFNSKIDKIQTTAMGAAVKAAAQAAKNAGPDPVAPKVSTAAQINAAEQSRAINALIADIQRLNQQFAGTAINAQAAFREQSNLTNAVSILENAVARLNGKMEAGTKDQIDLLQAIEAAARGAVQQTGKVDGLGLSLSRLIATSKAYIGSLQSNVANKALDKAFGPEAQSTEARAAALRILAAAYGQLGSAQKSAADAAAGVNQGVDGLGSSWSRLRASMNSVVGSMQATLENLGVRATAALEGPTAAARAQATQLRTISQEQLSLAQQAANQQKALDEERKLASENALLRIRKAAELEQDQINSLIRAGYTRLQTDNRITKDLNKNAVTISDVRIAASQREVQAALIAAEATKQVALTVASANIKTAETEAQAKMLAAQRAADLQYYLDRKRGEDAKATAAIQGGAQKAEAEAALTAAQAIKRAEELKAAALEATTRARTEKKRLDAELSVAEVQAAAAAKQAAIEAVAAKEKDLAVNTAVAKKNKELADITAKLAAATQAYNKAMEQLNAAQTRTTLLENGVAEAIKRTEQQLRENIKTLQQQQAERQRLEDQNKRLRDQLSQPLVQEGILAWLRNLSSTATLVSGPLSGITSRLQALASLTNRANFVTALQFGGAAFAINGLNKFANEAIRVAKNLEPVEQLLDLTRNSSERAGKSFEDFAATAMKYGLSLGEIAKPFARLKIATEGTILAGDRFKSLMSDMAAISATFALPQEQIAGMAKAVEQMLSKGTVQAEEFRQQLGDRLPAAARVGLLAYRQMTGDAEATMGDFLKAMENRQIQSAQFLDIFFDKFKKVYGIDSAKEIDNVAASQGRLSTAYDLAIRGLDKVIGATEAYKGALNALSVVLSFAADNASLVGTALAFTSMTAGIMAFRRLQASIVAANAAMAASGVAASGLTMWLGRLRVAGAALAGALALISGIFAVKSLGAFRTEVGNAVTDVENARKKLAEDYDAEGFKIFKVDQEAFKTTEGMVAEVNRFKMKAQEALKDGVTLKPNIDLVSSVDKGIEAATKKIDLYIPELEKKFGKGIADSTKSLGEALAGYVKGTGGKKILEDMLSTSKMRDQLRLARDELVTFQSAMQSAVPPTQTAAQGVGYMAQAFSLAIPALQGLTIAIGGYIAIVAGLKFAAMTTGFTSLGVLATGLEAKVGKLGRAFKLLGIAATGVAVGVAFFRDQAKAATIGVDNLLERANNMQAQFKTEGLIPKGKDVEVLNDLQTKIEELKLNLTSMRQEYDKAVDVHKGNKGDILTQFDSLKSPERIQQEMQTLQGTIDQLQQTYNSLSATVSENDKLMSQTLGTTNAINEANAEGVRQYAELVSGNEELRAKLEALREGRLADYEATAAQTAETERWAAAVASSGQPLAVVNAAIAERINLMNQLRQVELQQSVNDQLTKAMERAAAAKDGMLEAYDKQSRLNDQLSEFEDKAKKAGYAGDELTNMLTNYKDALTSIPEKTARAGGAVRGMGDDIDYSIKKIKPVEILQKSLFSFADTFAELAVSGKLSAQSLKEAFSKMALDISKEILAMVIKINIIMPMLKGLQGAMSGGGGGLNGLFDGMMGGGNPLGGLSLFADGGIVNRATAFGMSNGRMGVMGEAGAEAILPLARGPGGRLGVAAVDGASQDQRPMHITFNVQTPDAESFKRSEGQIAAMLSRVTSRGGRNM